MLAGNKCLRKVAKYFKTLCCIHRLSGLSWECWLLKRYKHFANIPFAPNVPLNNSSEECFEMQFL